MPSHSRDVELKLADQSAVIDNADGSLRISLRGRKLPWTWNVTHPAKGDAAGQPAQVRVRTAAGTEQTAPIDLSRLTLRRLSPTHLQWIGDIAGAEK